MLRLHLLLGFLCAWAVGARLQGQDLVLVGVGESWKLWPATREPASGWNQTGFADEEWTSGDSGFGLSTWGENTLFDDLARGSGTIYFRKSFDVVDPTAIANLILRCDWQGGFVAYLNGVEVTRKNVAGIPGTLVPYDSEAAPRYAGNAEEILLPTAATVLKPGKNVLTIQAVPTFGGGWDVVLVPELLANFTRGPYLQSVTSDRALVLWRTPVPLKGRVEYSSQPDLASSTVVPTSGVSVGQEVALTGLSPGQRYYYRVVAGKSASPIFSFRTLPDRGDLDFLVVGDSGAGTAGMFGVARQMALRQPDLLVHLGDIVYPNFSVGQTDTRFLSVYRGLLRSTASYFTWGNHDLYGGVTPFLAALRQPTNNTPAEQHVQQGTIPEFYYSFDAGDAHFSVLFWPYSYQYYMREGCPQLQWLEADLAASKKPWKFLCVHHPVNTSGGHRFDDRNGNGIWDRNEVAARLMPLAEKYGVQMIFSGHDHNFERFHPVHGTHLIVSGGGGIILYGLSERDPNSAFFEPRWHYTEVQLRGDRLRLVATDWQGVAFDALEFSRTSPDSADPDGDGLGPVAEAEAGTRPDSPDTDGDGRPDGWEFVHGLDPKNSEVGDRTEHLAVYLSDRFAPAEARLFLRAQPDGTVELRWLGRVGYQVVLESAATADGSWEAIPSFLAGGSLWTDRQRFSVSEREQARWFRLRYVPE